MKASKTGLTVIPSIHVVAVSFARRLKILSLRKLERNDECVWISFLIT